MLEEDLVAVAVATAVLAAASLTSFATATGSMELKPSGVTLQPVPVGGRKLGSRVAALAPSQPRGIGHVVLLVDKAMGDKFLVDTGAVFSVLPFSSRDPHTGPRITTADTSPIPCWGWVERRFRASGICFIWQFLRAKVAFPILGADFLKLFDLVVDLHCRCLIRKKGSHIQLVSPTGGSSFSKCEILLAAVLVAEPVGSAANSSTPSVAAVDSSITLVAVVDSSTPSVASMAYRSPAEGISPGASPP